MKNFRFLFVALMSVACLLGLNSCEKDDEGSLAGTTWYGTFDTRDYNNTSDSYSTGSMTYVFQSNICNVYKINNWVSQGESGTLEGTDTWFYDDIDYPTVVLFNDSGTIVYLYIENNSFSTSMPWENYQMTLSKK